jgi:hypothetical protein
MTTICWTIIHYAGGPIANAAGRVLQVTRHLAGPVVRRMPHVAHHVSSAGSHPRVWFELVCKVIPAAVVGGGLLIPQPANPPRQMEPPTMVQPIPAVVPWLPWNWHLPPTVVQPLYNGPSVAATIDEPSTGRMLLTGVGGLVLIRLARRHTYAAATDSGR